jgi:hypothetical protein
MQAAVGSGFSLSDPCSRRVPVVAFSFCLDHGAHKPVEAQIPVRHPFPCNRAQTRRQSRTHPSNPTRYAAHKPATAELRQGPARRA